MKKILVWAVVIVTGLFIAGSSSGNSNKTEASKATAIVTDMPTPTYTPTPTPTLIPTPTIDYQKVQQRASLQVRLQYIKTLIPPQEQRVAVTQQAYNDTEKAASVTQIDGYYINPTYGGEALAQMGNNLRNEQNYLNQLIEARDEVNAELGVN